MGCHTWSYAKITALSDEEKQKKLEEGISTLTNWWGFKESFNSVVKEIKSWVKESPEISDRIGDPEIYAKNMIQEYTDKLNNLKEKGFDAYVQLKLKEETTDIISINDVCYAYVEFDHPFRVYGYPEETFTNKKELLNWLKSLPSYNYGYYDSNKNEFIEGYTEELVKRIEDFYNKYGEENVYFEFG